MRSHHGQRHRRRIRRMCLARSVNLCSIRSTVALLLCTKCLLLDHILRVEAATKDISPHKQSNESSPHRRNLQPSFFVAECSVAEDPDAYFYTKSRGTLRRCKWLAKDRFRIAEECSTAEAVSRTGVMAITDADWNCPHTCGKCNAMAEEDLAVPIDEEDEGGEGAEGDEERVSDDSYNAGIGADLAEALGLNGDEATNSIDPFDNVPVEDNEAGGDEVVDDFELSDNIIVIEPNEGDDNDEEADIFTGDEDVDEILPETPTQQQPETQPFQEIKINILDPSGMGLKDDPVIGILPRRARTWQDVALSIDTLTPPDPMQARGSAAVVERDPFKFTEMPSAMPSASPTAAPSASPSAAPTALPSPSPSSSPTSTPSASPTGFPTVSPTPAPTKFPTVSPTPAPSTPEPTRDPWRDSEPTPSNAPSSYFNYNPWNSRGIKNWSDVKDPPEEKYWKDFDEYISLSLDKNQCNSNSRRQSPIDVRFDKANGQCFEYHQIRSKPGEYSIEESIVEKQILPNKLRFVYPRNWGDKKADWATANDSIIGPSADMPKGWGHQLPVTHVDIKVPSEHWMEGKQFLAEYQIFLIQNKSEKQRGSPAVSVLFDIHPEDEKNKRFQILLDAFQDVYDRDMAQCRARRRRQRRLGALFGKRGASEDDDLDANRSTWLDVPREEEDRFQRALREAERRTQDIRKFNPWTSDIVRTLYFFGYEGSLTEPPCTEFVEWRILDTPALISRKQYWQLRVLLFDHVDKNCKKTSVHYQGSVARPLQNYNGRLVHRCMCRDFLGDRERSELGINRCPWKDRDQWGFNRQQYNILWYERTHKYEEPSQQPLTDWASF